MTNITETSDSGVLPIQYLRQAAAKGIISAKKPFRKGQFQPSSLDLRLGEKAYRIRSSFLPQKRTIRHTLKELRMYDTSLTNGAILEKGNVYLIPLLESLNLPPDVRGRTNPKSSTGRLDIFTRVISDFSHRFEDIAPGYKGGLFLEVVPRSFTIKVKTGQTLNQLRLFRGQTVIPDEEIRTMHRERPLLFRDGGGRVNPVIQDGIFLSIEVKNKANNIVGYMAKKNSTVVDLSKVGKYHVLDFWEPVITPRENFIILEPEEFYIFASKERVRVPVDCSAEMVEYDAGSGELRTHYAGFFDSGFGEGVVRKGTKAVLEVRPHDVPFRVEDGQIFFKLRYEKMASRPAKAYGQGIGSSYHDQELKLSKHFMD